VKKREIEWVERIDGGIKRKVRVRFPGPGTLKWQFKRSDEELWDYDTPPTADDWEHLEEKVTAHYTRRRIAYRDVELVRHLRKEAGA